MRMAGRVWWAVASRTIWDRSGVDFAHALGFETANRRITSAVPCRCRRRRVPDLDALTAESLDEYDVVTWAKTCPPEYAEAYCAMHTQMANDVPIGEMDYTPVVYDETRLRSQEARMALGYVATRGSCPTSQRRCLRWLFDRVARPDHR